MSKTYDKVMEMKKRFPFIKVNEGLLLGRKYNEFFPGDRVYVQASFYIQKATVVGYDKKIERWLINFDNKKKGSWEYKSGKDLTLFDSAIKENKKEDFEHIVWDTLNY